MFLLLSFLLCSGLAAETFTLHNASANGLSDVVGDMLTAGADVGELDSQLFTPLMRASFACHENVMDLLLATGASRPKFKNANGTALHMAIAGNCSSNVVNKLLAAHGDAAIEARDDEGRTPLILAAQHGSAVVVQLLLSAGAQVDASTKFGVTALMKSASRGHTGVVSILLAARADVNIKGIGDMSGWTALMAAALSGHVDIVRLLLEAGATANAEGRNPAPLVLASSEGHVGVVRELLAAMAVADGQAKNVPLLSLSLVAATINNHTDAAQQLIAAGADANVRGEIDTHNTTAPVLSIASALGNLAVVRSLLEANATVDARDVNASTALMAAAGGGHILIVRELLAAGARVDATDRAGASALFPAVAQQHALVVTELLAHGANASHQNNAGMSPLQVASFGDAVAIVRILLDVGCKVDSQAGLSGNGTALHVAAHLGHVRVMRELLAAGASIQSSMGSEPHWTALAEASNAGQLGAMRDLLAVHSKDEIQGAIGGRALLAAVEGGQLEALKVLLAAGAPVDAKMPSSGETALILAASNGNNGVVAELVAANARLKLKGGDGLNALHRACHAGHLDAVKTLLAAGANVNAVKDKDAVKITPLMIAAYNGHDEVVRLLLRHGADAMRADSNGFTALGYAAQEGHAAIIKTLLRAGVKINEKHVPYGKSLHHIAHADVRELISQAWNGRLEL